MWSWCIESQDTAPKFISEGDTITVKGRYSLASQPNVNLLLLITGTRDRGRSTVTKEQKTEIVQGTGEFILTATIPYYGCPHLTFYDKTTGKSLGGLYFGTKEQVEEIEGINGREDHQENTPLEQNNVTVKQSDSVLDQSDSLKENYKKAHEYLEECERSQTVIPIDSLGSMIMRGKINISPSAGCRIKT